MLIGVLCTDHGIAIFARILRTIFNLLLIIGPTLCIVSIIISLIMVIKSPDADQKRTYSNNIRNSLIALFIVIMLPVIVNIVMGLTMMKDTFEIAACWDAAYNTKLEGYGDYQEEESSGEINTFVINPEEYSDKGTKDNPNGNGSDIPSDGPANVQELFKACEDQAEWMKNYHYEWEKNPTVEKSKKKGTCVTYVACVLQRVGALKPGKHIWHNGSGYGTGKVSGATSSMTVTYMNNKTLSALKSQLQPGDVIMVDDNRSGVKGNGGHIFIFTGKWAKDGNPIIYDNHSAEQVKKGKKAQREYSKNRKVLAVVRLSK